MEEGAQSVGVCEGWGSEGCTAAVQRRPRPRPLLCLNCAGSHEPGHLRSPMLTAELTTRGPSQGNWSGLNDGSKYMSRS